jgi:hypothetical protein
MAIGGRATTFETKKTNTINLMRINILDEGYFYTMRVLPLYIKDETHHEGITKMDRSTKIQDVGIAKTQS